MRDQEKVRQIRQSLVTVEDFLNSFNQDETAMLSHLDLPDDLDTRREVIEQHLDKALIELASWYYSPYYSLPEIVTINCLPCLISLARKSLEFNDPRDVTLEDYKTCKLIADQYIDLIKLKASMAKLKDLPIGGPITDLEDQNLAAFSA